MSNQTRKNRPTGQILMEKGIINQKQLDDALKMQQEKGTRLGDALVELGYISEKQLLEALSERSGAQVLDSPVYQSQAEAVALIPEATARRFNILPIEISGDTLKVATDDPLNFFAFEELRAYSGKEIEPVLSERQAIRNGIDRVYSNQNAMNVAQNINREYEAVDTVDLSASFIDLKGRLDDVPVVKLVNNIIAQAYTKNASDIHIEPYEDRTVVRIRIDGDLIDQMTVSPAVHAALITRLKIMADMNIAERRIPLDGRMNMDIGGVTVDIRAATLPTIHGEKMVLRLLATGDKTVPKLTQLGISAYNYERFNRLIKSPHGIVLVTGPTGSGKSTTLYSVLGEIAKPSVNIVTLEDPVEKKMDGINQVQINPKAGLTFASGMRSILRQDPDIIMLGEIRDGETASIAIRAAITGHLVFSTLHTNDAASSVVRLVDMDVEAYLVAASVVGVVAQRLVKCICPYCRTAYTPTPEEVLLWQGNDAPQTLYKGRGCARCNNTGYSGRTSVHEVLIVDAKMRQMIVAGASTDDVAAYAVSEGMITLRTALAQLVADGKTTLEEMNRVTYSAE